MESAPQTPTPHMSHPQHSEFTFSRTSTFCTDLYSSTSTNSKTCGPLNNLPIHPQPPNSEQQFSEVDISTSSFTSSGDKEGVHNKSEHSDDLEKDLINYSGKISSDSIHNADHNSNNMALVEQMDLQILSERLGIAITDNWESPSLDLTSLMDLRRQLQKVQMALQLRVEEHARCLQKMIEEQYNANNSFKSQASKLQAESFDQSSPVRHGSKADLISSPSKDNDFVAEFKKRKV